MYIPIQNSGPFEPKLYVYHLKYFRNPFYINFSVHTETHYYSIGRFFSDRASHKYNNQYLWKEFRK